MRGKVAAASTALIVIFCMQKNSKNLLLIGAIVAIFAVGSLWWQNRQTESPSSSVDKKSVGGSQVSQKGAPQTTGTAVKQPSASSLPSITPDGIYLVYYTKTGFSPQILTIPAGKSVRFVNNSDGKSMSVGSTDSSNIIYRAFNQTKTVGAGGTYEYTFVDKGTYLYNNKTNPGDQGIIVAR